MGVAPQVELGVLGWADSLILMVMALVVFGPRRLPQIGRQIGKLMYEFRKASNDFKFQMEEEMRQAEEADRRKKLEEDRLRAEAARAQAPPALPAPAHTEQPALEAPASTESAASGESHTSENHAGDSGPQIQPPSTGEPVASSRPPWMAKAEKHQAEAASGNGIEAEPHSANGTANGSEAAASVEAENQSPAEITEQATHHG